MTHQPLFPDGIRPVGLDAVIKQELLEMSQREIAALPTVPDNPVARRTEFERQLASRLTQPDLFNTGKQPQVNYSICPMQGLSYIQQLVEQIRRDTLAIREQTCLDGEREFLTSRIDAYKAEVARLREVETNS